MFLVHRKGLEHNGQNPVLLTGYGGFNVSLTPYFTPEAVITAERGGIYAVVNLRGGGEYGEEWHRAGMLANKQNVFDDFIASAEWLIAQNYTTPGRLGIVGASNGGLLVGAALTQRPDLFSAVICEYPLLDMIRYHKFLVAQYWVPEYGSADDSAQFQTLLSYSPYHNVKEGTPYPAVLFITGDSDTRVAPLHARKMTARVQAASSSGRPVLLLYDTKAGHAGGVPVNKQIEDLANALQFFFSQAGERG
jgi:prolyl oligopeptidase